MLRKHTKAIAFSLLFIFYANFVGTAYASMRNYFDIDYTGLDNYKSSSDLSYSNSIVTSKKTKASSSGVITADIKAKTFSEKKSDDDNSGPSQPEMATFKSVNADNMVNLFSGDFSYNIPLLDVGGYPINIFYNGGITMDQDASWVGLGWNINPGTITRNMRGLPDDFDGTDQITKKQSVKPEISLGASYTKGVEFAGFGLTPSTSVTYGVFYNTTKGMGLEIGGSYGQKINLSKNSKDEKNGYDASYNVSATLNSQEGLTINPTFGVHRFTDHHKNNYGLQIGTSYNSMSGISSLQVDAEAGKYLKALKNTLQESGVSSRGGVSINFAKPSYTPTIRMPMNRANFTADFKWGKTEYLLNHYKTIKGYFSEAKVSPEVQKRPAYGYFNLEKGNTHSDALLDFNRINDNVFTPETPVISFPYYTYDIFSIAGEGTGGTFRAYRNNIGFVADAYTLSTSNSGSLGVELSKNYDLDPNPQLHVGVDIDAVYTPTTVGNWSDNNNASGELAFQKSNGYKEASYFKNPGEKAIVSNDYFNAVGGDMISRLKLFDPGNTRQPQVIPAFENFELDTKAAKKMIGTQAITANTSCRNTRDKRSQIITYLNAEEASRVGLDRYLYSYEMNNFFDVLNTNKRRLISRVTEGFATDNYRKSNHISEIDVLEPDGKRYVYGIPVYNTFQKDVSFAVERPNTIPDDGIITYESDGVTPQPYNNSKDRFYQSEEIPAYAHSFLLTALLSPDYVDVTGNGISDDDLGDAIKFNYSRLNFASVGNWTNYKWRTPFTGTSNQAIYNEALKTDKSDDKASYTYGERESWYMHSIESKNMIAVFHLLDRNDNFQPTDELGNGSSISSLKLLDRIDLYSRAELLKNNTNAKPIKTVNFVYDYSLCKGTPTNSNYTEGKLTLKQIYFTYNGNNRQHKGAYNFDYDQTNVLSNPNYTRNSSDRWGTFKNASYNPAGISNPDYPFTVQNQSDNDAANQLKNDQGAASWNLRKILLPSGSQIEIDYEADDYGYVQSRRASQMFQIVGFGGASSATPEGTLAPHMAFWKKSQDYDYVFIDIPHSLLATTPSLQREEIKQLYIDGQKQLAFKLWVQVRNDILTPNGSDNLEPINVYADIEDWGEVNSNRIWVKVKRLDDNSSPILTTVIQFLKNNLNSKAYPSSYVDPNANVGLQTIRAIAGMVTRLMDVVTGLETRARMNSNLCSNIASAAGGKIKGFVRLANPYFKKIGGGYRVKEVRIKDNWGKMLDGVNNSKTSVYGQHYYYTTKTNVLGNDVEISSGVATYEPMIGAEENPFKEVMNYDNKSLPLGPTDRGFVDMPLCESFFPSASVGYSKVTVKSIHQNTSTTKYKSGIGSQVTEYYTSKEFPYFSDYTPLDPSSYVRYKRNPILEFLKIDMNDMVTLSQGFRVRLNDMNGKMKSQSSFAEDDDVKPITYTEYFYKIKKIGENKYKLNNDNISVANKNGAIIQQTIGKDIEVMTDFREHRSVTTNTSLLVNTDLMMLGPFPAIFPIWFSPPLSIMSTFRSTSVLKVINEYAILDRVLHIDKGSSVTTKNLLYDAETGETLVTETQNNFNNSVFTFNYPAHWAYQGMEMAYKNIDVRLENIKFRNGIIETAGVDMGMFESGDEIYVFDDANSAMPNTRACYKEGDPLFMPQLGEYKIWAVDITKDSRNTTKRFIFIDKNGIPFNSIGTNIRIVRSGKRNMVTANVGSITSFNSPIVGSNIVINNNTKVLNASAVEFKEKWKTEDGFYPVFENTLVDKYAPIHYNTLKQAVYVKSYEHKTHFKTIGRDEIYSTSTGCFGSRAWDNGSGRKDYYGSTATANFNFSDIPPYQKIVSAKLSLFSHAGVGLSSFYHPSGLTNYHYSNDPHKASQYANSNNFWISRIYNTTYSGINTTNYVNAKKVFVNLGWWENLIGYQTSTKSFCSTCTYTGLDNRIDITNLAEDMLIDRDINNRTGVGIKIDLEGTNPGQDYNHNNQERRVCFSSGFSSIAHPGTVDGPAPEIDIAYYDPAQVSTTIPTGEYYHYQEYNWQTNCHSFFERTQMNPYQLGLLGNWRVCKNYVFYGDRIKKDVASTQTDIQNDGIIDNFSPYWSILSGTGGLIPNTTTPNKWVWNSQISLVNKKGFEVENYDALMRFNSGVYGYNNNLPIAVANNAKYRETGFDGFEDYNYRDRGEMASSTCINVIRDAARHWKIGITDANLTTDASHTGMTSVKVNANSNYTFTSKVTQNNVPADPDVKLEMLDIPYTDVQPTLPGTGLTGYYYNGTGLNGSVVATRGPELPYLDFEGKSGRGGVFGMGTCDFCCVRQYPVGTPNGVHCVEMSTKWLGWIFLEDNGDYDFAFQVADDYARVRLFNGSGAVVDCSQQWGQGQNIVTAHNLTQGFYKIEVDYSQNFGGGLVKLLWKTPTSSSLVTLPITVLYPNSSSEPAHHSPVIHCIKPGTIQGISDAKLDQFSIIQGSKMVLSTWVKIGSSDCKCNSYNDKVNVQISFTGVGTMPTIDPFKPQGNIINGWQRLECVFDVPTTATGMNVNVNNTNSTLLYFDDLRIHPYNSNMKSFVYDPITLRLTAELDENNYASFYEYDNDGTLTRVKKETKEGIKTIKETRSALQTSVPVIQ